MAICIGKIYEKKPPFTRYEATHLKFEKAIKLTFVIKQIKLLILGFGIFEKVYSRPKLWSFENGLSFAMGTNF